jgi:hypothetical protein
MEWSHLTSRAALQGLSLNRTHVGKDRSYLACDCWDAEDALPLHARLAEIATRFHCLQTAITRAPAALPAKGAHTRLGSHLTTDCSVLP